jgi:cyclopropane-fatty-acyl-phospholipid synthase
VIPSLSQIVPAVERAGLILTDVEVLRLHYAETLRAWRERFAAHRDEARALFDERFCRMWEFYLAGAEAGFREGSLVVFQLQMAKDRSAVPLTRDYITDHDRGRRTLAVAAE